MSDYGLGDVLKRCTQAVGIKPCKGCEERAEKLNVWSRRKFMGVAGAVSSGLLFTTTKVWGMADRTQQFIIDGLSLLRWLNTIQVEWFERDGRYATKTELLGASGLLKEIRKYKRGTQNGDYLAKLNLESDELFPGWHFDFASTADGYVIVLLEMASKSNRVVFTTDQTASIFRGVTSGEGAPSAHDLANSGAKDFPGVVPHDQFRESGFLGGMIFGPLASFARKMLQDTGQCASCCYWSAGICGSGCNNPPCSCMFNCGGYPCAWCWFGQHNCGTCCCGECNSALHQCTGG